jgi:hypothetical protein
VPKSLAAQIRDAFGASGLTLRQLIVLSELDIGVPGMSRKMTGKVPWRTDEAEAVARGLRIKLVYGPRSARAA